MRLHQLRVPRVPESRDARESADQKQKRQEPPSGGVIGLLCEGVDHVLDAVAPQTEDPLVQRVLLVADRPSRRVQTVRRLLHFLL